MLTMHYVHVYNYIKWSHQPDYTLCIIDIDGVFLYDCMGVCTVGMCSADSTGSAG